MFQLSNSFPRGLLCGECIRTAGGRYAYTAKIELLEECFEQAVKIVVYVLFTSHYQDEAVCRPSDFKFPVERELSTLASSWLRLTGHVIDFVDHSSTHLLRSLYFALPFFVFVDFFGRPDSFFGLGVSSGIHGFLIRRVPQQVA